MPTLVRRRSPTVTALLACAAAIVLAACGGPPRPGQPRAAGDACELVPGVEPAVRGAPAAGDERPLIVGIPDAVNPANAPVPRNAAERLVFAQLYETLVRVGCDGRIEPGLATEWRAEDGGRSWVFTLRADARDWTGAPVTARDVAESWLASPDAPEPRPPGPAEPRIASLTVLDARTLRAEVGAPVTLQWFARPELAVRTAARMDGWPTGTGPLRPDTRAPASGLLRRLVLRPVGGGAAIEFRALPADPRNAVDADVDLLTTRDPAVAEYAAASGAFEALPLLWDRAYVLLSPGRVARAPGTGGAVRPPGAVGARAPDAARGGRAPHAAVRLRAPQVVLPPDSVLRALARDAVKVDARPARELFANAEACGETGAWQGGESGSTGLGPGAGGAVWGPGGRVGARDGALGGAADPAAATGVGGGRAVGGRRAGAGTRTQPERVLLLYPPGDPVAQALAERLVALAPEAGRSGAGWLADAAPELAAAGAQARAGTVGREDFASALRRGAGPVVARVERVAGMDACGALAALVAAAPWLGGAGEGPAGAAASARGAPAPGEDLPRVVPLIETRPVLLVRRGVAGVAVDGRGTLLLGRLRRVAGGEP